MKTIIFEQQLDYIQFIQPSPKYNYGYDKKQ